MGQLTHFEADNRRMDVDALIATGRAAVTEGRWDDAQAAFEVALTGAEPPEALDGLAEVRYWQGDYAAAVASHERAYAGFRARGETRYPAYLAGYILAFEHMAVYGNAAVAGGWLERGMRLARVSGDCPERGWVELARVLATDDLDEKERHIAAALDIARRFGDADLEFDALAYAGVTLVERGRVAEGMRRVDEAAAATCGGEVTRTVAAGEIFCKMLLVCEMTLDVSRAEQWQDAATRFARRSNVTWASGICRMHYGGILTAAGRWAEAGEELETSLRIYDSGYRALRSGASVRLADLRVRQGHHEDAELLLTGCAHDSYAVRPLARMRLAGGDAAMAATLLRRHLDSHGDSALTAPLLALLAEAELTAGNRDAVVAIATRLAAIAADAPLPFVRALADFVTGICCADTADAVAPLESALAGFGSARLGYDEARTRLWLARCLADGQRAIAVTEARTALTEFDRLGAVPDADAAAALLRSLGVRGRTGPKDVGLLSRREQEVLRLIGLGLSNPEIAERLFISRKTAAHHVSNILAKLGLRNRTEAAAIARTTHGHH